MMKLAKLQLLALVAVSAVACTVPEDGRFEPGQGPGNQPWNHSDDVTCTTHEDCGQGEVCEEGVCQMSRCLDSYVSSAPLGPNHYFGTDGELAIISDSTFVDAFEGSDGAYVNSWDLTSMGGQVLDVAGGNMTGSRPHSVAIALELNEEVYFNGSGGVDKLNIGIWPKAIAAGDVDADGLEELIAFAEDGAIARCDVEKQQCSAAKIDGVQGKDVAVGDVDGDGFAEAVFLLEYSSTTQIVVWNLDAATTGQEESYGWSLDFPVHAMSAGDLDGDRVAELVLLEDRGWFGWADDKLHVFSPAAEQIVASHNIDGHTLDVAVGDRNSDEIAEIAILREGQKFQLFKMENGQLASLGEAPITVGSTATRISMLDWDGDSASGKLVEGPELVAGQAVPIAALMFPPYPRKVAMGDLPASIMLGDTQSTSEEMSDTLSLGVGLGLSFGAEAGIFKAKVGATFNKDVSVTRSVAKSITVGARYSVFAQPDLQGTAYAPVVMSCGCYHRYRYVTEDPAGRIGGSGQTLDVFVPVGGQTQLWSSKRYNAMAEATGLYPTIEIPIRVGDVSSYPNQMQTLDGQPVAEQDILFPQIPSYQVSDVGFVNFWLARGESETNAVAETTKLGINSSIGAFGVGVDADLSIGVTQGYSISVGKDNIFAGGVPPIPDDPNTPEDEFDVHRYSFSPFVYRHHYQTPQGEDAAYYVLNFAVGK